MKQDSSLVHEHLKILNVHQIKHFNLYSIIGFLVE